MNFINIHSTFPLGLTVSQILSTVQKRDIKKTFEVPCGAEGR